MTAPLMLSREWAAPILWGISRGYSIADIAEGLDISEAQVVAAIEAFGPIWLARQVRATWPATRPYTIDIDRAQRDWAYANWLKAKSEARRLLLTWDLDQ